LVCTRERRSFVRRYQRFEKRRIVLVLRPDHDVVTAPPEARPKWSVPAEGSDDCLIEEADVDQLRRGRVDIQGRLFHDLRLVPPKRPFPDIGQPVAIEVPPRRNTEPREADLFDQA
jgi:hypothetical protein